MANTEKLPFQEFERKSGDPAEITLLSTPDMEILWAQFEIQVVLLESVSKLVAQKGAETVDA